MTTPQAGLPLTLTSRGLALYRSSPVLVSKTRVGKNKYWQAHVLMGMDGACYTTTSYWQDTASGASVVQWADPYAITPKNVGKANATTAREQAVLEFDATVQHQRDRGYTEAGTVSAVLPLPMLAQTYSKRKHKLTWPVYVQPKYNGSRMLFDGARGWSRGGKLMIPQVIQHLLCDTQGMILDGELILPGNVLLQETMQATKKYRPGVSDQLRFVVYDVVMPDVTFAERYALLCKWFEDTTRASSLIELAPTVRVSSEEQVMEAHAMFVAEGFEGTIVRDATMGYEVGQRSNQLQKYKDFLDAEFKIVAVQQGNGKYLGSAIFKCVTPEGKEFDCTPEGTMESRREMYEGRDALIGKWLTVRYFELSADKIPLFPIGVTVRETQTTGY